PSGQMGGAERSLLDFMASLRAAEPQVVLELIAGADGALLDQARALGVRAQVLTYPRALARLGDAGAGGQSPVLGTLGRASMSVPSAAHYITRLRRVLAAAAPNLIHTNGFKMHVLGVWAAPRSVPVLWHVHDYVSSRPLMARLMRAYAKRCAAAIANSRS